MSRKSTDREAAEQTLELITKFIYESNNSVDDMPVYFDPELMPFIAFMEYGADLKDKCSDVPSVVHYREKAYKDAVRLLHYRGEIDEAEFASLFLSNGSAEISNALRALPRPMSMALRSNYDDKDSMDKINEAMNLIDSARISGMTGEEWPTSVVEDDDPEHVRKLLLMHYETGRDMVEAMLSILEGRGHRYCYAVQAGLDSLMKEEEEEEEEGEEKEDDDDDTSDSTEPEADDSDDDGEDNTDCPKFLCTEEDDNDNQR